MKKLSFFLLVLLTAAIPAYAKEKQGGSNVSVRSSSSVSAATPSSPQKSVSREEMKKRVEEKKSELNGSEWKVALNSAGKEEGEDTLTFQNGQVTSKTFANKGFPSSNYTITVPEGADMATWETMQTNPKGGVLFMRGEWKADTMRGVISQQIEEGKSKDYNFASAGKAAVPPTTEKKEEPKEEVPAVIPMEVSKSVNVNKNLEAGKDSAAVTPFNPGTTDEKR